MRGLPCGTARCAASRAGRLTADGERFTGVYVLSDPDDGGRTVPALL